MGKLSKLSKKKPHKLLSEFIRGRDPNDLLIMLKSKSKEDAKAAAWIASEINTNHGEFIKVLPQLLGHEVPYVRFFSIYCVVNWINGAEKTKHTPHYIRKALNLLKDEDERVRNRMTEFVFLIERKRLRKSLDEIENESLKKVIKRLTNKCGQNASEMIEMLKSESDESSGRVILSYLNVEKAPEEIISQLRHIGLDYVDSFISFMMTQKAIKGMALDVRGHSET